MIKLSVVIAKFSLTKHLTICTIYSTIIVMKDIIYLKLENGKSPLIDWLNGLDRQTSLRIRKRLLRLENDNPGYTKKLTSEISEIKFTFGAGYRIYYSEIDNLVILLINGGDKSTQNKDIQNAQKLLKQWKEANHEI